MALDDVTDSRAMKLCFVSPRKPTPSVNARARVLAGARRAQLTGFGPANRVRVGAFSRGPL